MERKIKAKVKGYRTTDGAGVSLVRVLGRSTVEEFDPILMLDSFDSTDPKDYTAGFPLHPHRGIETISYLSIGKMVHKDTLGNEDMITDGEIQWMNAGSGIKHEEKLPAADRMLGVQLWLNLPKDQKMSHPTYNKVSKEQIPEIEIDGGFIRLLAGEYKDHRGYCGDHLPFNYYDIHLKKGSEIELDTDRDSSIMLFTLVGDIYVSGELIEEKTAIKLTEGDTLLIKAAESSQILFIESTALNEPVAWAGPIVMNTEDELRQAFVDLDNDDFIKEQIEFND